jgi:nucleosome binding factor SPN SPT16 subunit
MSDFHINAEKFYKRLDRLIENWSANKNTLWGGSTALCIPNGANPDNEETNYTKSAAIQMYLFGYEIPDSITLITKNAFYFMATEKKCKLLEGPLAGKSDSITFNVLKRTKDEAANQECFSTLINVVKKAGGNSIGSFFKSEYLGNFIPQWLAAVEKEGLEKIDISPSVGLYLSVKDDSETDFMKRASVLTNKVLKHGFISEMENILDSELQETHENLAQKVEKVIYDPSKINVKVSPELVNSCFYPIVQSGGKYDIKVSAQSNSDTMTPDIILCSLGAKYKEYCANVSRTFMVDAPAKVEKTYAALVSVYDTCLEQMTAGADMSQVITAARSFLKTKHPELLPHLPKSLGFAIGLQFRDSSLVLNEKNTYKFSEGMTFNVAVGFHNVPLTAEDKNGSPESIKKLEVFSLLIADTVRIQGGDQTPEVLTKASKDYSDVSYSIADGKGSEDEEEDADDGEDEGGGVERVHDV